MNPSSSAHSGDPADAPTPVAQPDGAQLPADHAGQNGAAFRPTPGAMIGRAAGNAIVQALAPLLQALPQLVMQGVAAAIGDKPMCGKCALARAKWDRLHGEEMAFARAQAAAAAEMSPDDPRAAGLDLRALLAPQLHPGAPGPDAMPRAYEAVTSVAGWGLCHPHVIAEELAQLAAEAPAAGEPAPGRAPLLLTPPGMSPSAAAAEARKNVPGLPGYASP